ncbi:MAG: hypothetical protein P4M14_06590 [Gammaproteobacteria bacterium]|nr:hypothetical protein [Gammaproteobacteria bacterium]
MQSREKVKAALKELLNDIADMPSIPVLEQNIEAHTQEYRRLNELKASAEKNVLQRLILPKDIDEQLMNCKANLHQNMLLENRCRMLKPFLLPIHNDLFKLMAEYQSSNKIFSPKKLIELQDAMLEIKNASSRLLDPKNKLELADIRVLDKTIHEQINRLIDAELIENIDAPFNIDATESESWEIPQFSVRPHPPATSSKILGSVADTSAASDSFYDDLWVDGEEKAPEPSSASVSSHQSQASSSSSASVMTALLPSLTNEAGEYLGPILPPLLPPEKIELSAEEKQIAMKSIQAAFNELNITFIQIKKSLIKKIKDIKQDSREILEDKKKLSDELNSFEVLIESKNDGGVASAELKQLIEDQEGYLVENDGMLAHNQSDLECIELCQLFMAELRYESCFLDKGAVPIVPEAILQGIDEIDKALESFMDLSYNEKRHEADNIFKLFAILLCHYFPNRAVEKPTPKADSGLIHDDEAQAKEVKKLLEHIQLIKQDLKDSLEVHDKTVSILQAAEVKLLDQLNKMNSYFRLHHDVKALELTEFALSNLETDTAKKDYYAALYQWINQVGAAVSQVVAQKAEERWARFNITIHPASGRLPMLPVDNLPDSMARSVSPGFFDRAPYATARVPQSLSLSSLSQSSFVGAGRSPESLYEHKNQP